MKNILSLRTLGLGLAGCIILTCLLTACGGDRRPIDERLQAAAEAGRSGKWAECSVLASGVLKQDPDNESALLLAALAAERSHDAATALRHARKAAEQHADDFLAQYILGKMLAATPHGAGEALTPLRRAARLLPGDPNTRLLLAQCAAVANADETPEYFQALPPALRNRPELRTQLALWYVTRRHENPGYLQLAGQELAAAFKSSRENPRVVLNCARYLDFYAANPARAVGFYQRYLRLTEHNPQVNAERARINARLGELSERNLSRR